MSATTIVDQAREGDQHTPEWTTADAATLYRLNSWGAGFFSVNGLGHLVVHPREESPIEIDLREVVEDLCQKGVELPVLIRFQDVLRTRVRRLNTAFQTAISESGYQGAYQAVYPIKVNQLREVVEEVMDAGRPYQMGLECGSKAELVATLALLEHDDTLLVCNGVKDRAMLSLILSAQRLGKNVNPVMEKFAEFEVLQALGRDMRVRPRFGVRVRLSSGGAGRWEESAGHRSKFGLSIPELLTIVEELRATGQQDRLTLLHFHMGSQITDVQILKKAVKEMAQIYARLAQGGTRIRYLDVGGGLGVNYDVGYSSDDPGINYSLGEYANAVVYTVQEVCKAQGVAPPIIVTESGRALTAHHSVLVVPVLGSFPRATVSEEWKPEDEDHPNLRQLAEILDDLRKRRPKLGELREAYHDTVELREELDELFALGYLSLEQKALGERLYWSACMALLQAFNDAAPKPIPVEVVELEEQLIENYLCDFSVFQSILDHWAIGQGFPVVPLQRLNERPTQRAVLVDLTCDSDGKMSHYVTANPDKHFLELHALEAGQSYYLGFFLMGAYQDILGDSHNLFGRVSEAHVYADAEEPKNYYIEKVIPATSIREMLGLVQYFPNDLHRRMDEMIKRKVAAGVIRPREGIEMLGRYDACFARNTYFDPEAI